ncbi:hypothetical protein [Caballeronia sp. LZ016]|uniref:hypothetical protein n=1 Tax=Caballeronia sp. LZ016 TaxID=3038554 RepID=UPI0028577457|nr:hypothetical protein [Caballeronia sp. LZ016]MDR5739493.1 hypothetical protein [Caballeronia sp. LZ016]
MRILRPAELHLMRQGLPSTPANFKGGSSSSSASTTNNTYADKRNAVQDGIGVSGDGNMTSYSSYSVTTDGGAVQAALSAMQAAVNGAVGGITAASQTAVNGNTSVANTAIHDTVTASSHLADVGLSMLQANTALANSLMGGVNQSTQAVTGIASQLAQTQIASQNDNRYLIAAGLAVVCIVGVMAFAHKG